MNRLKKIVKSLRTFRVWHRYTGLLLAVLLFISAVTGILLSLKKDIDILQPPSQKGISKDASQWLPIKDIAQIATDTLSWNVPNNAVDRIDVRPSKGMAKVLFEQGNWEVQVDLTNGNVLSIAKRHSDWIEALHDGSIVADWFKLLSMNTLGLGVLLLIGSGIWLYFGPSKVRRLRKQR